MRKKITVFRNASEGRTDVATLLSMYIAHADCRRTEKLLHPKNKEGPKREREREKEMPVYVALRLDSHLLQRVAYFNALSLYSWFSGSSGRVGIAAQVTHLIREGRVYLETRRRRKES